MNQRQVRRATAALAGAVVLPVLLTGCGITLDVLDRTHSEDEFVGSYVGDGTGTRVALDEDGTFTAVGVPGDVLDDTLPRAVRRALENVPDELEGTWRYVSKGAADHVALTVTGIDGLPARTVELPLYVADADDLFFLPDRLGREKVVVSRAG
ncbi:hypothetical protein ACFQBY_13135 [Promicromonospora citrea]|uniref:Uncharacterized protein n=1 Tax=Promicromonospora citrea TaxID=43677 RepID=A0A8H9GII9_9MICO|nr:hypothetical protein [Promicromonospora citrea]NNH52493.1 hypothetical protein [Promicromonospora citrea]GGM30974.1 hypothetical protein GCM10010102_27950 [Promicromonospora citrea]